MKTCLSCLKAQPITEYYWHRASGLYRSRCKTCLKAESKTNYQNNRPARIEAARVRRAARRSG